MRLTEIMNLSQVNGALRVIVPTACAFLAAKGFSAFSDSGIIAQLTAFVLAAAAVVWSIMAHTDHNTLANAAAIDPAIKIQVPDHVIVADAKIADVVADPRVPNVTAVSRAK